VAVELTEDHMVLMHLAEENGGWVSFSLTKRKMPQFSQKERFLKSVNFLLQEGMVWEDRQPLCNVASQTGRFAADGDDGVCYWFPSVMQGGAQITESMDSAVLQEALQK